VTDEVYGDTVSTQFSPPLRLQVLAFSLLLLLVAGAVLTDPVRHERARLIAATTGAEHAFRQITTDAAWAGGTNEGTRVASGSITMSRPVGTMAFAGTRWSWTRWTSWWVQPGQDFTQLVPTWNAVTPTGTWVQVQARVRSSAGAISGWKVMGSWATRDLGFRRTSSGVQADSVASVSTDTLVAAAGVTLTGYQLRVVPLRSTTSTATATVRSLQAVASRTASTVPATSRPLLPAKSLPVPTYSQMIHSGQYPQWGGGGQAWCSPTSLSMILGYYRALPASSNYTWVSSRYADRWVDHVARVVYDYGYQGAGNWAFNTAYAANLTYDAFVTRLTSLREAERFIAAGIPLAASISFSRGQLSGAPISATNGHLVVIAGFTADGDVVVNDPAASSDASVRRVYDRAQFERVWLQRSSGTVYVVRDAAHPLPLKGTNRNW
jgi:hypothetical protein